MRRVYASADLLALSIRSDLVSVSVGSVLIDRGSCLFEGIEFLVFRLHFREIGDFGSGR
jgi:hypothetical protein